MIYNVVKNKSKLNRTLSQWGKLTKSLLKKLKLKSNSNSKYVEQSKWLEIF